MTNIIVLSDSHGNRKRVEQLLNSTPHNMVFFLGDGLSDFNNIEEQNVKKVCGNCDFFSSEAISRYENVENLKIMLTHGHEYKTKFTKMLLLENAKNNACDIVCSGHTHKQGKECIDGILFLNPGAFKNGEYAIITLQKNETPEVQLLKL